MGRTPQIRIVGLGLSGTLLAWVCERAGLDFELVEPGDLPSASRVAAGIINPITGQRLVKSWRIDELLPVAVDLYRELEAEFGQPFLVPYRLRRLFADAKEKQTAHEKWERGELAPFATAIDDQGLWIEPVFRVDLPRLLDATSERWRAQGLVHQSIDASNSPPPLTIWCVGAEELRSDRFRFAGLRAAKGEMIEIEIADLVPDVIVNRRHWVLPMGNDRARVGATFIPDDTSLTLTPEATVILRDSVAASLVREDFRVATQFAGTRVTTADKHPVIGRHPLDFRVGLLNGLGSKGALLAPWLAVQWQAHLRSGAPFDPAVRVDRFWRGVDARTVSEEHPL